MQFSNMRQDSAAYADKIFLNSAGSSLVPEVVFETMVQCLKQESLIGGYALAEQYAGDIQEFYQHAARLINCNPENIAYTTSATDGYTKAITSIDFKPGDVLLTSNDDYISNYLSFLSLQQRYGIQIVRAGSLPDGDLDLLSFEALVTRLKPKLVALTYIPSISGMVMPATEVGKICRKHGILYLLDACQAIGQMVVDVKQIGCDFLSTTGRKFLRGPRGTGFLYVSDRLLDLDIRPMIFDVNGASLLTNATYKLAPDAKRFEFFEHSLAAKLGLGAALKYLNTLGIATIAAYNFSLMQQFRTGLMQVKGLELQEKGSRLSNILTFTTLNRSLEETAQLLKDNNVYFSISNQYPAADSSHKKPTALIRLSPHYFNTQEELEKTIDILSS